MAIYKRDIASINLETGTIHRTFLNHSIGYKDQKADHFGIRVFRDGEPVDLTGVSVQGVFMPPRGDPIAITSGNIVSGNVAEVVLPQACYNYDGQFCLAIKLVDSNNSVTGTMRIVDGMVDNTHASGTVAPTSAVPTYQEILSTYDAMVAATAAANGAIAATYSSSSTYKVGDYCIHDGGLYRCTTAITTAEAWTSGHWTAAKIGPDVSDLKSALEDETGAQIINFTKGAYINTSGSTVDLTPTTSSVWSYAIVDCTPGDIFTIFGYGGSAPRLWCFIDSSSPANVIGTQAAASAYLYDAEIVAPVGATKLVLNKMLGQRRDAPCYIGSIIKNINNAISEKSPNLVSMTDGSVTSHGVTFTRSNGKLTVKNSKSDTGASVHKFSNTFNVPAGDYYFGSRYGIFGSLYLQLLDYTDSASPSIIKQTQGFVKVMIESDTLCACRINFTNGTDYNVDLYPELIPVAKLQDYTPYGLLAVDDLARSQNEDTNSGFVSRFPQKRIAVIGDSMSSCRNDVYCDYTNYVQFYPAYGVNSVEQTWWKMVADASGSEIAFNESEGGAFVTDQRSVVIPGSDLLDLYERVLSLKARDVNPDLIFVSLGHNDGANSIALGDYDFDTTYTSLSESTFRTAYIKGIKAIQNEFPGAKIVCIIFKMVASYAESISYIADILGCEYIDCRDYTAGDSTHPNANGMRQIASTILYKAQETLELKTLHSTDLHDATDAGIYGLTSTVTYDNSPLENGSAFTGARMLQVFPTTVRSSVYLNHVLWVLSGTYAGNIYIERRTGTVSSSSWTDWIKISSIKDMNAGFDKAKFVTDNTILKNYDYTQRSAQGANVGTNIRVMSYNLAHFNFDTATYISAEKLGNLHKLLMNVNADFLCLQEDDPYIDSGDTKLSDEYLYYPMYPVSLIDDMYPNHNVTGTNVRSKRSFVSRDSLEFTESHRPLRYCVYSIDGKTLLLISAHPGLTEEERAGQYEELFKWINGDITLNRYYTETAVSVPEFTHCIIGMDSNAGTATDRANLTSKATTAGYKMANGGVLGWIDTEYKYDKQPLDNIIVSGNVIINNIEVLSGWYDLLYSDHVPIYCDVTLLDS